MWRKEGGKERKAKIVKWRDEGEKRGGMERVDKRVKEWKKEERRMSKGRD